MQHSSLFRRSCLLPLLSLVLLLARPSAHAQTSYIGRWDVYTGFSDLNTPGLNNINQIGFHLQAGANVNRWSSLGFDYSTQNGATHLTPGIATPTLQAQLAATLPPGYNLALPVDVTIQTFTAGGQVVIRHYRSTTFFVRPVLAAFHIKGTPEPTDPVNTAVAHFLAPQGSLTDWYGAYGAGGGAEFRVAKHYGVRVQFDAGYNHPFSNILANGAWTYRSSIGPAFHFGHNILK